MYPSAIINVISDICRYQWPRRLRRRSAAARLLGLWVRIPPVCGCVSLVSSTECGVSNECNREAP